MSSYQIKEFPKSRIATIDIFGIGLKKHHVVAMIELDVTATRKKLKASRTQQGQVSFTAWLISTISLTLKSHEMASAYLYGKRKAMIFDDINVSLLVEKTIDGHKVPLPLVIEKAHEKTPKEITRQIKEAVEMAPSGKDIVLQKKSGRMERLYYTLPGFMRRKIWNYLLRHPRLAFKNMGNVAFTSIGMMGNINGWFIPASVHPLCFGAGSITKKPVVIRDEIVIREILHMTILLDHDVVDGGAMARFIRDLSANVEGGLGL